VLSILFLIALYAIVIGVLFVAFGLRLRGIAKSGQSQVGAMS
jgi:hypothetical protein